MRTPLRELVTGRMLLARPSREGDRVTNVELFFDLVYVFAFTQVTGLMSEQPHGVLAIVQGLGVLGVIWWSWTSYAWLANQSHADRGLIRVAIVVATGLMFVVSLAIPGSFHHQDGDAFAPTVFVVGVGLVTLLHATVYLVAAGDDRALRRQIVRSMGLTALPVIAILAIGAVIGGAWQAWLWLAAPAIESVIIYVTSHGGDWRVNSLAHFSERHGLVVMLALGESVVAVGTGLAAGRGAEASGQAPLTWLVLAAATVAVVLALAMWWCYFDHLSEGTEHLLRQRSGVDRVNAVTDVFTYLHLPLVAGIIIAALGIEQAMHGVSSPEPLGVFGAVALGGGLSLYLAVTALIWLRVSGQWSLIRFLMAALCLAAMPLLAALPALAGLPLITVLVVALAIVERVLGPAAKVQRVVTRRVEADPGA